jgi:hypothetical protein
VPTFITGRRVHLIIIIIIIIVFVIIIIIRDEARQILRAELRRKPSLTIRVTFKIPGHPDSFQFSPGPADFRLGFGFRSLDPVLLLLQRSVSPGHRLRELLHVILSSGQRFLQGSLFLFKTTTGSLRLQLVPGVFGAGHIESSSSGFYLFLATGCHLP